MELNIVSKWELGVMKQRLNTVFLALDDVETTLNIR